MKFKDIKAQNLSGLEILIDADNYHAHSPKNNSNQKPETLKEHLKLVENYFLMLVELNQLEPIVDKLIDKLITSFSAKSELSSFIKTLFYNSIIYHDFGKINHLFQQEKMNNLNENIKKRIHKENTNHSSLSSYIFLIHHFKRSEEFDFDAKNETIVDFLTTCFSFPIYKHHSSYLSRIEAEYAFSKENINYLKDFLTEFTLEIENDEIEDLHDLVSDIKNSFSQVHELKLDFDFFPLFALLKLNYSLITASDYYATSEYMNNLKFSRKEDFGLITADLKNKIFKHFENNNSTSYNGELIRNTEKYLLKNIDDLREKSNLNLNYLRQKLGAEVLTGIEKYKGEKIFYIEAPTGGGKTNMSMIAIRKILELHPEITKVFYVFPFTTLITQTTKAIKETFGLNDSEIAQVHSKAGFQTKNKCNEEDAYYGNQLRDQIDNLFVNYPFTLLTHIKFFDILKSNKKDTNYLLHRLANSIVIIDELQSYNPKHWDKIKYFISKYSEFFNIRFIIMSATLPQIDKISLTGEKFPGYQSLIPCAQENYLTNPNFSQRVSIKTELLDKKSMEPRELSRILINKSREYAQTRDDDYKGSVHTIIEFIFKKSASKFYETIKGQNNFFDEIFVLSGTIIEPRRKYIIEYLKDKENRKKKVLLITTQVVEAGVDIDMDIGFKNQSLIDSDEQLAGRINRNTNKTGCSLWLFKYDTPKSVYGKDLRYDVTLQFSMDFVKEILETKNFKHLYEKVFEKIKIINGSAYRDGFNDYKDKFSRLNFEAIHKDFRLIENESASIFVPENIDVKCYKHENNFSQQEIDFIKKYNCFLDTNNQVVSGENIWQLYIALIKNTELEFTKKSIDIKLLNGIMSKFVFSVFIKKAKSIQSFMEYNEEHADFQFFQYYKLKQEGIGRVYDINSGINEKLIEIKLSETFEFI